jgi:hypothetical protein
MLISFQFCGVFMTRVRLAMTRVGVVEAITGELKPAWPEDAWAMKRNDGSW